MPPRANRAESALTCQNRHVTYRETLHVLAQSYGIATSYRGNAGELIEASEDTLLRLLDAMGVDARDPGRALAARRDEEASRPLPWTVVTTEGYPYEFTVHVPDGAPANVWIELEDGGRREVRQLDDFTPPHTVGDVSWGTVRFEAPADLPQGWHRLRLESSGREATSTLVVTPERISRTAEVTEHPSAGVMAQLYSARSRTSWGIGDFRDLSRLAEIVARSGFDFLLTNPLHAAEPFPPIEDSPYLPTTRRFINPIYLCIEDVPEFELLSAELKADVEEIAAEFQAANFTGDFIDRNPIFEAKLAVLRELFHQPRSAERAAEFAAFVDREGTGLVAFARWCADRERAADVGPSAGAHALAEPSAAEYATAVDFYMWLQFLCDEQLAGAQQAALAAGMRIGIVADLAVGTHPGGADATVLADYLAPGASVGAPPDGYNQRGQDWSQPPWHPEALARAGYRPWRDILRTVLRHSGGIRVDHVLGLFRLFWIPRGLSPQEGAYVSYDFEAMLGILALEAERAGAVVIGEDLGTFEQWVQEALAYRGVMGTNILWFESDGPGVPKAKANYRRLALASVGTHDLPPTAGFLAGEHIRLRDELGLFTRDLETEDRDDLAWQNTILDAVRAAGCFDDDPGEFSGRSRGERGDTAEILVALTRFIAATPAALTCTQLVDLVGDLRTQNQPGTTGDLYPNWRVPLCDASGRPVLIEDLPNGQLFDRIARAALTGRGR